VISRSPRAGPFSVLTSAQASVGSARVPCRPSACSPAPTGPLATFPATSDRWRRLRRRRCEPARRPPGPPARDVRSPPGRPPDP
jgi:hypothetical protein